MNKRLFYMVKRKTYIEIVSCEDTPEAIKKATADLRYVGMNNTGMKLYEEK